MTAVVTAWVHLLSHLKVLYPKWNCPLAAVFVAVYSGAQLEPPKSSTITWSTVFWRHWECATSFKTFWFDLSLHILQSSMLFLRIAKLCTQSNAVSMKRHCDHCISACYLPFCFVVLHKKREPDTDDCCGDCLGPLAFTSESTVSQVELPLGCTFCCCLQWCTVETAKVFHNYLKHCF